ncbi:12928_t:CDS:2 [Entrophospora sp. SA101]|nr:12928_t:CDS:2 [Entrophospora sp. SA101]
MSLCSEEGKDTFEKIKPKFLEFFNRNDRINPLQAGTLVIKLSTTTTSPLVIRYPLSNSEGKKEYGEWEICEVLKEFLHKNERNVFDIDKFDMGELSPPPSPPTISEDLFKSFLEELKRKKDSKDKSLCLRAEEWLNGSCSFGPVDYSVDWIPRLEISDPHFSELDDEMKMKQITNYITSILQMQVNGLETTKNTKGSG